MTVTWPTETAAPNTAWWRRTTLAVASSEIYLSARKTQSRVQCAATRSRRQESNVITASMQAVPTARLNLGTLV